jgi:hypothetical protein
VVFLVGTATALGLAIERDCHGHLLGAVAEALLIAVFVASVVSTSISPRLSPPSIPVGSPRFLRGRLEVSGAGSIRLVGCNC